MDGLAEGAGRGGDGVCSFTMAGLRWKLVVNGCGAGKKAGCQTLAGNKAWRQAGWRAVLLLASYASLAPQLPVTVGALARHAPSHADMANEGEK